VEETVSRLLSGAAAALLALTSLGAIPAGAATDNWPEVFDPNVLRTLNLQMTGQDWDFIRKDLTETYRPGWLNADGETPIYVAIRRKSSRALPSESNPIKVGLKIDINEYVDGQAWHGLTKLSLENGTDSGVVEEGLAWAMHRMAGAPMNGFAVAYANWVRVNMNGQYIGVYLNAEQRDKQALRQRGIWSGGSTWLYEQTTLGALLEDGDPASPAIGHLCYSPFKAKSEGGACRTPSDAVLATDLPAWLDMEAFLTYCAVEALVDDKDGLCDHNNNSFFVDVSTSRMAAGERRVYMPWDLDTVFQNTRANIYGGRSNVKKLVQSQYEVVILNHPIFRAQYNGKIFSLTDPAGPLSETNLNSFLDQLETILGPSLAADPYPTSGTGTFDRLQSWLAARYANARSQATANSNPPPRS
jgi:hypothetical protein